MNTDDNKNNKYLFTGQEFDGESELYYYNARYYNPLIGRFISVDPMLGRVGNLLARNEYVYALNNPLKYVDPSGETPQEKIQQLQDEQAKWIMSMEYNIADFLKEVKDWNYNQQGNILGKAGGAILGIISDSIKNLAKSWDPNVTGNEKALAKGLVILDIVSAGRGSAVEQGFKAGAENVTPKVLEMIQPSLRTTFKSGKFAGQLVSDVILKLKSGAISAEEVVVGYVERNGRNIIVNNKSFSAVKAADVAPVIRNFTGVKWAEDLATKLLKQSSDIIYDVLNFF